MCETKESFAEKEKHNSMTFTQVTTFVCIAVVRNANSDLARSRVLAASSPALAKSYLSPHYHE